MEESPQVLVIFYFLYYIRGFFPFSMDKKRSMVNYLTTDLIC